MIDILKIIFDKSVNNSIIDFYDIDKIIDIITNKKSLHKYISYAEFSGDFINNLGSFDINNKKITLYSHMIKEMVQDIESDLKNISDFEKRLYENFMILQIILHEVEHANQYKIIDEDNTLESFLLRLSFNIDENLKDGSYDLCPEERLAEIKSFDEIISLITLFDGKYINLLNIVNADLLKRMMNGYHYHNEALNIPINDYFFNCNKKNYMFSFDYLNKIKNDYCFVDRCKFGFPISNDEYFYSMHKILDLYHEHFNNKVVLK